MLLDKWLTGKSAAEVMVRRVITLDSADYVAHAAHIFLQEQVSGAPVVDREGICVGVLSIYDVIGAEEKVAKERERIANSSFWQSNLALPTSVYAERLAQVRDKIIPAAEQPIDHFMTRDIVWVSEQAPLRTVIRDMVDAHIHRVVVLNEQKQLRGLISTIDVLASLLRSESERG